MRPAARGRALAGRPAALFLVETFASFYYRGSVAKMLNYSISYILLQNLQKP